MKKSIMKGSVLFGLVFLFTAGLMGTFLTDEVVAQIRPAYTKNVDEPGLAPFSQTFTISNSACGGCGNCCFPETGMIPVGKRLVIQNVSGYFTLNAYGNMGPIIVQSWNPGPPSSTTTILTLPVVFRYQWDGGVDYPAYEFNHAVQAYVDAGKTARLSIYTGVSWGSTSGQVTINGYLVSLP
jgi:hypothetical protein